MNTEPKFYTREGWLTDYALRCGYIHSQKDRDVILRATSTDTRMYEVCYSGGLYAETELPSGAVSSYGDSQYPRISFESIGDARKFFKVLCGDLETHYEPRLKREVIS